jgi:Bacterial protein of unknown function (DUF937)
MAINLVSLVMQCLTPDMIGRIATALGLNRNNVQPAIGAAVPALLAGFSGKFAGMLGAGGQTSLAERGSQMLASLLGGQEQTALAGAVGKLAGLGQGGSGSLLGMLGPAVIGTISRKQQGTGAIDAGSIAGLLANQKDNIAAALPAGFGNLLGGTGLLDVLGGAARTATAAGGEAARAATSTIRAVSDTDRRAAGTASSAPLNWLGRLRAVTFQAAQL